MTTIVIVLSAAVMLLLALVMAFVLGWANQALAVEVDPKVAKVNTALPGANCGACGYVGCNEYAEAVAQGRAPVNKCPVGGESCAKAIAEILGVTVEASYPYRPAVHCGATYDDKLGKHEYRGERRCATANLVANVIGCTYGCLGFGDCVQSCDFDAIHLVDGQVVVDYDKCVGCGACEKACPRHIISMVPFKDERMFIVACSNKDFGKDVKGVCKVGCLGCKACERLSKGLFTVEDNISTIDYDQYDPETVEETMEVVLEKCPMKRIVQIGTPSQADRQAVKDEDMPTVVHPKPETTVDKTEWLG
jgi:Na+-translocating ferredoxin:NAD+ oxidoreductase subunit B